jgi:hypothetical protein
MWKDLTAIKGSRGADAVFSPSRGINFGLRRAAIIETNYPTDRHSIQRPCPASSQSPEALLPLHVLGGPDGAIAHWIIHPRQPSVEQMARIYTEGLGE